MLVDLRHAMRRAASAPLSTLIGALGLALGLAATMIVFAVFQTLVLHPGSVPNAAQVQMLDIGLAAGGKQQRLSHWSYPAYVAARDALQPQFRAIAVTTTPLSLTLRSGDSALRVNTEIVSPGYFSELGVLPQLGHDLTAAVDEGNAEDRRLWLSQSLWREQFGADPAVIGRPINLQGVDFVVAGILPAGFRGLSERALAWIPISAAPRVTFARRLQSPTSFWHAVFVVAANDEVPALRTRLAAASTRVRDSIGLRIGGELAEATVDAVDWNSRRVDPVLRRSTSAIALCALLLLAIVTVNLALLALARQDERRREIGVRIALGAGRAALLRALASDALPVFALGLVGAWLLCRAGIAWLAGFGDLVQVGSMNLADVHAGSGALLFGLGLGATALLVVLFGPARATIGLSAPAALVSRDGGRRLHGRRWLAGTQFALATALAIGAGFAAATAWRAVHVPLGFDPAQVLTAQVSVPSALAPADEVGGFLRRWTEELRAQPGVESAATAACLPLRGGCDSVLIETVPRVDAQDWPVELNLVGGDYFRALGLRALEGRYFDARDNKAATPTAVLSATAAKRYFPQGSAVGQRIKVSIGFPENEAGALVIGVVGDVLGTDLDSRPEPMVYLSSMQVAYDDNYAIVRARPEMSASSLAPALATTLAKVQPELALFDSATMEQRFDGLTARRRLVAGLIATLAGLAVLLAATGVFAVFNLLVHRRRREFGVRMALGASRTVVRRLVLVDALRVAAIATGVGLALAAGAVALVASQLPAISVDRWPIFATVAPLMLGVAVIAGWWPARRAANADPISVLREEP